MSRLEILAAEAWRELVDAPMAVLVLAKASCPVCKLWLDELQAFLDADQRWQHVSFGALYLDEAEDAEDDDDEEDGPEFLRRSLASELDATAGSLGSFGRANRDWLPEAMDFPYNVAFVRGRKVKAWPGGGIERLVTRLEGIEPQGTA